MSFFEPDGFDPARFRSAPGITVRERSRMIVLGAVLLAVLGAGVAAWVASSRDGGGGAAPATPAAPAEALGPPGIPTPGAGPGGLQVVPLFPEEQAEVAQERLVELLASAGPVADGVAADDGAPFEALLEAVTQDHRLLNLSGEGFAVDPDLGPFLADPASHRGHLVRMSGELLSLERLPYAGPNPLVRELRRGVIRTASGALAGFTHGVASPHEPVAVEAGGGWVRVRGAFYKTWPVVEPSAPPEPVAAPHLVLTAAPVRDYPPVAHRDIDPAWIGQVLDAEPAEMVVRDEPPFFHLLNMLRTLGPQGFEEWCRTHPSRPGKPGWPPENFTNRARELLSDSSIHRFRPVSIQGYLRQPKFVYDLRPNPGNVEGLWLGFVVADDLVPVWVYRDRPFVAEGFREGTLVRVEGIYYKQVAYEPRGGGEMRRGPVVLASRLVALPRPGLRVDSNLLLVGAGSLGLLAAFMAIAILRARREDRESDTMWRARVAKRRVSRAKTAPGGAADDAPGEAAGGPPA
jgi:hypothetical protein